MGGFRRAEATDRLLILWEKDTKRREAIFNALVTISGYDQRIEDPYDEQPESRWLNKQFPRHDDVLARLMERVSAPAEAKFLARLIPGARWSRGQAVDPILAGLINHPSDEVRQKAVEAIGWRLRKREGEAEPLKKALAHKDTITQYLAAEALARTGRGDGLNILLASIDFATEPEIRRRAVLALGELADERALDVLLELAGEDGHALQEQALEAIGHLGRSRRADEVFKLLERHAKGNTGVASQALNGLRWLDTRAGWGLIRGRTADRSCPFREEAAGLLGYNDEPATRDLLLRLLAENDDVVDGAMQAARRLFGRESLEPDYAVLQNESQEILDDYEATLARVRDQGEPRRVFEILPKCPDEVRATLATGLLNRAELPVAEALAALDSPDPTTAGVAARILGRAGVKAAKAGPEVVKALARWRKSWDEQRPSFDRSTGGIVTGRAKRAEQLTACVRDLVWAAGRMGVAIESLTEAATVRPDDVEYYPIRLAAVLALNSVETSPGAIAALESAALAGDPSIRAAAAQAIAHRNPKRASDLANPLLSDRVGFLRLMLDGTVNVEETPPYRRAAGPLSGRCSPGLDRSRRRRGAGRRG